ncbi:hypothetical protein [Hymenobacter jeollabukensis]|uniref:DUF4890 domain-containing protein n=1 Tax=Hymenobacter jeollabukensis TaxID=2025313 RepID=A0A5R8WPT6_9BACT|nr:hypothetical protein [Hymenobacter jeollabukensis]TLM92235.1 hypothetical protein FDY95_12405 [Hymenobacter jeollabukensis]
MKKLLTTTCLSLLLVGAFAQGTPSISQRAADYTRTLAPRLGLDDARQLQVKRLTISRMEKEQEIDRMYVGDEAVRQPKLQAVAEEYRTNLKTLLTAAQYQRFEQWAATAPANATAAKP